MNAKEMDLGLKEMKSKSYRFLRVEPRNGPWSRHDAQTKPKKYRQVPTFPKDPDTNTLTSALNTNLRP